MGNLYEFSLNPWIEQHNLTNYLETGLGWGISLLYALEHKFKKFYSVDLDEEMVNKSKYLTFDFPSLSLYHDYSTNFLQQIIPQLEGNSLIFLDAHVARADKHEISYEESLRQYKEQALPLVQELKIISENCDISKQVIIIDDLCIYNPDLQHESLQKGVTWRYHETQKELGLETNMDQILPFFEDMKVEYDLRSQGYLIATPKISARDEFLKILSEVGDDEPELVV